MDLPTTLNRVAKELIILEEGDTMTLASWDDSIARGDAEAVLPFDAIARWVGQSLS